MEYASRSSSFVRISGGQLGVATSQISVQWNFVRLPAEHRGGDRIYREGSDGSLLMFVSLFETGALVGPAWAVEAARDLTDVELASHSRLLELPVRMAAGHWEKHHCTSATQCLPYPVRSSR